MKKVDHNHEFVQWVFNQHRAINHQYDRKGPVPLPYEFHLNLTANVADRDDLGLEEIFTYLLERGVKKSEIRKALYAHDILEDVPSLVSYNDLLKAPGIDSDGDDKKLIAELVFSVTNSTGRNRAERADNIYYNKIRSICGGTLLKMCDKIANVDFGLLTSNKEKLKSAKEEYPAFKQEIYFPQYDSLFVYVEKRLNIH